MAWTKASCLIGHPQGDRLAELLCPVLGLGDEAADLVGAAGQEGLGEPHALVAEFADDVEGLVALLGLEAVDGQDQVIDVAVSLGEGGGVLVPSGNHAAVALQVVGEGVVGEADVVGVSQFGLQLGDGPVPGEAAEAEPAEQVPGNHPPGQGDLGLGQGADGATAQRAGAVGAVGQFAHQFQRARQRMHPVEAVVAHRQPTAALLAALLLHRQHPTLELRLRRPTEPHRPLPGRFGRRGLL